MTEKPEWKAALKESNAIGWIAFFLLVVAIGVGAVYFGSSSSNTGKPKISQVAK